MYSLGVLREYVDELKIRSLLPSVFLHVSSYVWDVKEKVLLCLGFPDGSAVKNLPTMQATWVQPLGQEDPLEKGMPVHSSILAWRISWKEEPGGLQFWGCKELDTTEWLNTHQYSSLKIPWTETGGLKSMRSQKSWTQQQIILLRKKIMKHIKAWQGRLYSGTMEFCSRKQWLDSTLNKMRKRDNLWPRNRLTENCYEEAWGIKKGSASTGLPGFLLKAGQGDRTSRAWWGRRKPIRYFRWSDIKMGVLAKLTK